MLFFSDEDRVPSVFQSARSTYIDEPANRPSTIRPYVYRSMQYDTSMIPGIIHFLGMGMRRAKRPGSLLGFRLFGIIPGIIPGLLVLDQVLVHL